VRHELDDDLAGNTAFLLQGVGEMEAGLEECQCKELDDENFCEWTVDGLKSVDSAVKLAGPGLFNLKLNPVEQKGST
jgi:hypothetical protein